MLAPAAMESLRQSTFRCGDFADSSATVYYEFGMYPIGALAILDSLGRKWSATIFVFFRPHLASNHSE
jgi:hypothetical protein